MTAAIKYPEPTQEQLACQRLMKEALEGKPDHNHSVGLAPGATPNLNGAYVTPPAAEVGCPETISSHTTAPVRSFQRLLREECSGRPAGMPALCSSTAPAVCVFAAIAPGRCYAAYGKGSWLPFASGACADLPPGFAAAAGLLIAAGGVGVLGIWLAPGTWPPAAGSMSLLVLAAWLAGRTYSGEQ